VSLAHEALLRKWDRVADWVRDNRAFLRIRSRVEQALKRWTDAGNRSDLLLPEGLDLEEASALLKDAPLLLAGSEYEPVRAYITASQDHHEKRRRRIEATRRTVTFFLSILAVTSISFLALVALGFRRFFDARDAQRRVAGNEALANLALVPNRYPDQILTRARVIGFSGFGANPPIDRDLGRFVREAYQLLQMQEEEFPVLLPDRTPELRQELARLPAYLPFWRTDSFGPKVTDLAFAENDRFLLAKFEDGTVRRWELRLPDGKPEVVKVDVANSDESTAVTFSGDSVLFHAFGRQIELAGHPADATAWALDTDRKRLVIGLADGSVFAWDVSGQPLGTDRNLLEIVQTRQWFDFDEAQDLAVGSRKEADVLAALWAEPEPLPFDPESTKPFRNRLGMRMLHVAPGEFTMGSSETEEDRQDDETPHRVRLTHPFWLGHDETPHRVRLTHPFWLGQYEVTQAEWTALMGENPSSRPDPLAPVTDVSWDECQTFLAKLNEVAPLPAGWIYALPTEAQWEYACRAGTETPFTFGKVLDGTQANCDGTSPYGTTVNGPNLAQTVAVGRYPANPWGFYDLHGNVFEWCRDWYGDYEFKEGEVTPDPNGRASGVSRVHRGGSWNAGAWYCRSAFRGRHRPVSGIYFLGFRVAAVPSPLHPEEKPEGGERLTKEAGQRGTSPSRVRRE
jgi:formylglycine-generating enzyme required for sulfatase activity